MPRQLNCRDMCKTVTCLDHWTRNRSKIDFTRFKSCADKPFVNWASALFGQPFNIPHAHLPLPTFTSSINQPRLSSFLPERALWHLDLPPHYKHSHFTTSDVASLHLHLHHSFDLIQYHQRQLHPNHHSYHNSLDTFSISGFARSQPMREDVTNVTSSLIG